jgi:DHA1 family multidrug resistance protein-like MFS transporter
LAVAAYCASVFVSPLLGPFIGGFITTSYLGWRWTQYITAFMGFTSCLLATLLQDESYPPVILVEKASNLRRQTRNWGIHAKQEEVEVELKELLTRNISRPLRILFTEPIVFLVSLYMSFLYGLLYLLLTAYALIFQDVYGFSPGVAGLTYFGFIAGEMIALVSVISLNPSFVRKLKANDNILVPEWRIPIAMIGGVSFAIGEFPPTCDRLDLGQFIILNL